MADTTVGLHLDAYLISAPEEDALVTALCQGVEEAFEILIQRYQQPVYNLVCRLLNDPSDAADIDAVVAETIHARTSERQGRLIDHDQSGAMERKKQEGYF